jgi:hydrogenase expression/formation protein HypC
MCLAFPARIKSVDGNKGFVEVNGEKRKVKLGFLKVKPGDYVVVHANRVVDTISEEEYLKTVKALRVL